MYVMAKEAYSTSDKAIPEACSISGKEVGLELMFYYDLTNTVDILHFVVPLCIYIFIYCVPVQSKNIIFYTSHLYSLRLQSSAVWICVGQCTVTIFWGEHTFHSLGTRKVKAAGHSTIVVYPDRQYSSSHCYGNLTYCIRMDFNCVGDVSDISMSPCLVRNPALERNCWLHLHASPSYGPGMEYICMS